MTRSKGKHQEFASFIIAMHLALLPLLRAPVIRHQAVEYVPNNRFPQIEATIESEKGIQSAKLYFRAAQHPDFYYVEMTEQTPESFRAVIPMPEKETEKVVYYIEATGNNPDTARTELFEARTTDQPLEAYFRGDDPGIVVGKVLETSPDIPPGFQTAGIVGFIGAAGTAIAAGAAGGGGAGAGIGAGTAVLVGAAVGAGASGVAVLASEGESGTGNLPSLRACFTTLPDPAIIEEGEAITLDGRCSEPSDTITSYRWELGDGRSREGPFIQPIYRTAGSYNATLTISDGSRSTATSKRVEVREGPAETTTTTTTVPLRPLQACFSTTPDPPVIVQGESVTFDGRCSEPAESITTYEWDLGDGRSRTGPFITPVYQTAGTFAVSLKVGDGTQTDITSETLTVNPQPPLNEADLEVRVSGPSTAVSGGEVDYVITLTNNGPQNANSVTLTDTISSASVSWDLQSVTWSPQISNCTFLNCGGSCPGVWSISCDAPILSANQSATLTIQTCCFEPQPSLNNTATVNSSSPPDPVAANNTDTLMTPITGPLFADLAMSLTGPLSVAANTDAVYQILATNNGPDDDPAVTLNMLFRATSVGLSPAYVSGPPSCTPTTGPGQLSLTCPLGMAPVMADFILPVTVQFLNADDYDITASFTGIAIDLTPASGSLAMTVFQRVVETSREVAFTSHLQIPPPDGRIRAQLLLNETRSAVTNNSRPFRHQFRGRSGENKIEGRIISKTDGEGLWRFDFTGAHHFVPGSLRIEMGNVLSVNSYQIVFRVGGIPGERIRFSYQISP